MGGIGCRMKLRCSGARLSNLPDTIVTFKDVAGVEGSQLELQEVLQFFKDSEHLTEFGARISRGGNLEGLPGTGKTLLALAIAGVAVVSFFYILGSEFVEMLAGVGESSVRDVFANARKNACVSCSFTGAIYLADIVLPFSLRQRRL